MNKSCWNYLLNDNYPFKFLEIVLADGGETSFDHFTLN